MNNPIMYADSREHSCELFWRGVKVMAIVAVAVVVIAAVTAVTGWFAVSVFAGAQNAELSRE